MLTPGAILDRAVDGARLADAEALALADCTDLAVLMRVAASLRDRGHGDLVSYSRKVFIPLTQLCRDVCHYCTFAHPPRRGEAAYLDAEEVLAIARAGAKAGCKEALFTLGDKPELRYRAARDELNRRGLEHDPLRHRHRAKRVEVAARHQSRVQMRQQSGFLEHQRRHFGEI